MSNNIQVLYNEKISGHVIQISEFVSLNALEEWKKRVGLDLKSLPFGQRVVMLMDTNRHEFESLQYLKKLRDFFTTNVVIQSNGIKVASVQPKIYLEPHIISKVEAYFESVEEVYKWLEE
jgi:hypothetical protein